MSESVTETFVLMRCGQCSMPFYVTQAFNDQRKKDHGVFCCPVGHTLHWNVTEADKDKDKTIITLRQTVSNLQAEIITLREVRATEPKDWRQKIGLK